MPNNVLAVMIDKLQAQVTLDAPQREAWMKNLKKWHPNLTHLQSLLRSESARLSPSIDALALEWVRTGLFPKPRQDEDRDMQLPILRERIHRAHIFAKWLEVSGFQICAKGEHEVLAWLLIAFWNLYGRMAWLETVAPSV